jgi:2-polyprenyl-6-methoxyphenol hydroxylase-like FAD-dependent oxidoreductase
LVFLAILGSSASEAVNAPEPESTTAAYAEASRIVFLLQYVGADYGAAVVDGLREYEERRRPAAYSVVDLSRRGMFTRARDGSDREEVDPIALRYERGVEGVTDVQV